MYKRVARFEVHYGQFRDALKALQNAETLGRKKGLTPTTHYVLDFGPFNIVIAEWEYETFAQYERDTQAFLADEELRAAWAAVIPHIVQGTLRDELWRPLA